MHHLAPPATDDRAEAPGVAGPSRGWTVRLAFVGDTMLGRGVAARLGEDPKAKLVAAEVVEVAGEADIVAMNLECCISERGEPWPDPHKPFFFRAPPVAVETLVDLGVSCVTLANNHALDYGYEALCDTFGYLKDAGIAFTGAGHDLRQARAPALIEARDVRVAIAGVTDHPAEYAAGPKLPGVSYANLRTAFPGWLKEVASSSACDRPGAPDALVVMPHWGPNMVASPVRHVMRTASRLVEAGATLVVGHSAHVFHGVASPVLYDIGDFLDDYATDPSLRNDLGLLFIVTLGRAGITRIEAVPLALGYCYTCLATGEEAARIKRRFRAACAELGTEVSEESGRLVVEPVQTGSWTASGSEH